jgi:hypothetical protein
MKKQTFTIGIAFLFSMQTKAQNTIPPNNIPQANIPPKTVVVQQPNATAHEAKILGVMLLEDSAVMVPNSGPQRKHYLKAQIRYNGVGFLQYRWARLKVDGYGVPISPRSCDYDSGTLQLSGRGMDELFTDVIAGLQIQPVVVYIEIISPNVLHSNALKCAF